ncbi:MAG: ribonuclease III [Veillonellaceae bacterium]|nr:ribonuclease III [Veillonellaceae bacterium]
MTPHEVRLRKVKEYIAEYGIPIGNPELLSTALTHTSYANEHRYGELKDNERLEFLGDAILDLVVGEYLFLKYPDWAEGDLTRAKASAVCEKALADCAARIDIGRVLLLGKGEEQTGGRERPSILADAFEAMVGAMYLDTSYERVQEFVLAHLDKYLARIDTGAYSRDYKTELQEFLQQEGDVDLYYRLLRDEGPDHDKTFYIQVEQSGVPLGQGVGKSKKEAAQAAAQMALQQLQGKDTAQA